MVPDHRAQQSRTHSRPTQQRERHEAQRTGLRHLAVRDARTKDTARHRQHIKQIE